MMSSRTSRLAAAALAFLVSAGAALAQPLEIIGAADGSVAEPEPDTTPPAERYFTCLWQTVEQQRSNMRLVLVRVLDTPVRRNGNMRELSVRIERVIGVPRFEPVDVRVQLAGVNEALTADRDARHLMNLMIVGPGDERGGKPQAEQGERVAGSTTQAEKARALRESFSDDRWFVRPMTAHVYLWAARRNTILRTPAVPIPEPVDAWVDAFEQFATGRGANGSDVDAMETLQQCLRSRHRPVRMMASQAACANAVNLSDHDRRADAYARLIIAETDAAVQRNLAKVYFNAIGDVLPRDLDLLPELLTCRDPDAVELIARGGLSDVRRRRPDVATVLVPLLEDGSTFTRLQVLRGVAEWGEDLSLLAQPLSALARKTATTNDAQAVRKAAVQLLLDGGTDQADSLALDLAVECPSAVLMEHLVDRRLYPAVPTLIAAAREKTLTWSRPVALAVAILTGRPAMRSFEAADMWWRDIETEGQVETMVETGFAGRAATGAIEAALADLDSTDFRKRRDARRRLQSLIPPVPAFLREAAEEGSAERRLTIQRLIAAAMRDEAHLREELAERATTDRKTLTGLAGTH
ncbi:MAG: hypothetical protein GVY16_08645 [Planctomycetes bacterium]|nr:hypothetical protein [Planctomycetota bacterium]